MYVIALLLSFAVGGIHVLSAVAVYNTDGWA